jgi:hypothetical protein
MTYGGVDITNIHIIIFTSMCKSASCESKV